MINYLQDVINYIAKEQFCPGRMKQTEQMKKLSPCEFGLMQQLNDDHFDIDGKEWLHLGPGAYHAFGRLASQDLVRVPVHETVAEIFSKNRDLISDGSVALIKKKTEQKWRVWTTTLCREEIDTYMNRYPYIYHNYICMFGHTARLPFEDYSMDFISYFDACAWDYTPLHCFTPYPQELFQDLVYQEFKEVIRCLKLGGTVVTNLKTEQQKALNIPIWIIEEWQSFASQHLEKKESGLFDVWEY